METKTIEIDLEVHRLIEIRRESFDESQCAILRRILDSSPKAGPRRTGREQPGTSQAAGQTRSRGQWTVDLFGEQTAAANLKDAYRSLLLGLHARFPDFLEKFSRQSARSRRFVARSPSDLYIRSPYLAEDFADELVDGWFYDTNLNVSQVAMRARMAASVLGLHYGKDVRILDDLKSL